MNDEIESILNGNDFEVTKDVEDYSENESTEIYENTNNNSNNEINNTIVSTLESLNQNIDKLNKTVESLQESKFSTTADGMYEMDVSKVPDYQGRLLVSERLSDIKVSIYERDISFSGSNIPLAQDIYYAQKLGLKLRNITAELNGGVLVFDGNKFRSSSGRIAFNRIKLGFTDMIKGFIRKSNADSFFLPSVTGHGTLQLRDTVKYLYMIKCQEVRKFIVEDGVYAASAGQFKFGVHADTKLGSVALSGKNILQTTVEGRGILILELPVPPNELVILKVTNDRPVRVNEQQVIYREGNVHRNKKLASGIFGSLASGTGFVEEYTGEGLVVLAPSLNLTDILSYDLKDEIQQSYDKYGDDLSLFGRMKSKFSGNENQNDNDD